MVLWLIHSVLNVFAGGRSMVKTTLLLVALSAAVLLVFFSRKAPSDATSARYEGPAKAILAACLLMAFVMGMLGTAYVYRSVDAEWGETLLATSESSYSSTRLIHSHVMKAGFASIAAAIPALEGFFEGKADIGTGYKDALPPMWGWVAAVLLLGTVSAGVFAAVGFVAKNRGRHGLVALYVVALVSTIKNAFDGGIMSHEAVPAITVLLFLYGAARPWARWSAGVLHGAVAAGIAALYFSGSMSGSDLMQYCLYFVGLDLVYLSWLFLCRAGSGRWKGVVGLVAGAACLAPLSIADLSGYEYSRWPVRKGSYMLTYGSSEGVAVDHIGGATVYRLENTGGKTPSHFASASGDTTMYTPIIACSAPDVFRQFVSKVASREGLSPSASTSLARAAFEPWEGDGQWKIYDVEAFFSSCLPRSMNALSELVRIAGGDSAIVILPYAYSNQYPRWKAFQPR